MNDIFVLKIYEESLKKAIKKGCIGIGNLTFLKSVYKTKALFPFFINRIPPKNHIKINSILKKYNIEKYDEMELLRATKAKLETDRYYVKEYNIKDVKKCAK
ncbi:MAG: hypothetical protein J6A89_05655 [Clostridia bacterium]|nr:hypothetical protein [Clostridia bacterium]